MIKVLTSFYDGSNESQQGWHIRRLIIWIHNSITRAERAMLIAALTELWFCIPLITPFKPELRKHLVQLGGQGWLFSQQQQLVCYFKAATPSVHGEWFGPINGFHRVQHYAVWMKFKISDQPIGLLIAQALSWFSLALKEHQKIYKLVMVCRSQRFYLNGIMR